MPAVYPILSRYGYNPDLRRTPSSGLHILTIQTCDTDYNSYIVVWSDHWCTVEPISNLIESDIYIGLKSEFFEMLHEAKFVGRPFQMTGCKQRFWCIQNYRQEKGGFCTVNCVNNIVDYKMEQYEHFRSLGPFLPLTVVIDKSMVFLKGLFNMILCAFPGSFINSSLTYFQ